MLKVLAEPAARMRVKTLEVQAYELMRERIITGEWPQGMHLKDNEIAAPLGISATPVREALRKLASEGLVETVPYRGTFVASMSAARVNELFNVRLGLELLALDQADASRCAEQFGAMQAAIEDFDRALARNHLPALLDSDMRFHSLLVAVGGNAVLDELYRQLTGRVQMLMAIADLSGRMAAGNTDHRGILAALRTFDVAAATNALRDHLTVTRDCLLAVVAGSSGRHPQ